MNKPLYAHYYEPNKVWILSYSKTDCNEENVVAYLYPNGEARRNRDIYQENNRDASKEGVFVGQLSLVGF